MKDAVFISPGNAYEIYQGLSKNYSEVETPTWALLLDESYRSIGFNVNIIDVPAERLIHQEVLDRVIELKPSLISLIQFIKKNERKFYEISIDAK